MHDLPLITTIAAAFTAAWVLGLITQKLKLSPIVGYLLAGIVIGPYSPGFVGDAHLAAQLAEVGVILLMFGVGLHFHLDDLLAVRNVALPGAVGQSLVATLLGVVVAMAFGWSVRSGLVLGMALSVASTVVLIRVLTDHRMLDTTHGHVAVGWLIVEDIFTVIVLVLIPAMGTSDPNGAGPGRSLWIALPLALAKLGALVAILGLAGSRAVPWIMVQVARLRSRELFTLTVLVMAIAIATVSAYTFGASLALGAFLAGMIVGRSPVAHQAAADALPLRDAFAVLFFTSVGMLFDPMFLVRQPLLTLACLGIVLIGKPLAALTIVAAIGYPARTALTVALGLAQIGEFSFILSEVARKHGLTRGCRAQRPGRLRADLPVTESAALSSVGSDGSRLEAVAGALAFPEPPGRESRRADEPPCGDGFWNSPTRPWRSSSAMGRWVNRWIRSCARASWSR